MPARILIIEDNPANLELMSYLLEAHGHTVLTATDGTSGIDIARTELPDLILCDVQMPGLDGFAVARELKGNALPRAIPLIAVTALAMVGDRDRMLAAGFDGYLPKPITPETFICDTGAFLRPELRAADTVPDSDSAPSRPPKSSTGRRILVVDDMAVNLELAVSLLQQSGHEVLTAQGIEQALNIARHSRPDLILSDVCMGRESGFDFIREVKADPTLQGTPFVFLTATTTDTTAKTMGMALGATRYLVRPLESQQLLAEIENCLRAPE